MKTFSAIARVMPLCFCVCMAEHVQYSIRRGETPSHGVNLGGWLVAEHWLSYDAPIWDQVPSELANQGEYATMRFLGHDNGDQLFEKHRASWITSSDIYEMASFGINMVRVPVGYWIVETDPTDVSFQQEYKVFAPGALKYLDVLINDWAFHANVAVLIELHAHKGSQNGRDHSACTVSGTPFWSKYPENVANSLFLASTLANRYSNSPAFLGLGLMNEPEAPTDPAVLVDYYKHAYELIRGAGNDCILAISPLLTEQDLPFMQEFMNWPRYFNLWHQWHPYFVWGYAGLDKDELITAVKRYGVNKVQQWRGNYLYLGEWSLGAPSSASFWNDPDKFKLFGQAQLDAFAGAHAGWTFWSWRHSDDSKGIVTGWSMRGLLRNGTLVLNNQH